MQKNLFDNSRLLLIDNQNITDPHLNLALEEYAVKKLNLKHNYLLIYVNKPSLVVGKHQNIFEEVNTTYIRENKIPVLRRISGGKTVYHDLRNPNLSFITPFLALVQPNGKRLKSFLKKISFLGMELWGIPQIFRPLFNPFLKKSGEISGHG